MMWGNSTYRVKLNGDLSRYLNKLNLLVYENVRNPYYHYLTKKMMSQ